MKAKKKQEMKDMLKQMEEKMEQKSLENMKRFIEDICHGNYIQEVSDTEKVGATTDIEEARRYLQGKQEESEYTDRAFMNLVKQVNYLENEMKKRDKKIVDLEDAVDKLKEKNKCQNKKMQGDLDKIRGEIKCFDSKIEHISGKIKDAMNCIKSIGVIADFLDDSVKGKNMKKELNKVADRKRSENRKYRQMYIGIPTIEKRRH